MVKIVAIVFLVIITLGNFGVSIAPLIALAGAGAFGATVAIQGPLSNYGAGVSIILARPFVVGNTIAVNKGASGVVEEITLAHTILIGEDGERITVPNKEIVGRIIVNSDTRRVVQTKIAIQAGQDIDAAKAALRKAVASVSEITDGPVPEIGIHDFTYGGIILGIRFWVPSSRYFELRYLVNEAAMRELASAGVKLMAAAPTSRPHFRCRQMMMKPRKTGLSERLTRILVDMPGEKFVDRHIDVEATLGRINAESRADRDNFNLIGEADIPISFTHGKTYPQKQRAILKVFGNPGDRFNGLVVALFRIFEQCFGIFTEDFNAFVRIKYLEFVECLQNLIDAHLLSETYLSIRGCNHGTSGHHAFQKGTVALTFQTFQKQVAQGSNDTTHETPLIPIPPNAHSALTGSGLHRIHYRMGDVF